MLEILNGAECAQNRERFIATNVRVNQMKKLNLVLLLVVMSIQLYAAETRVMSYQGLLTDAKQQIVADSIYSITFAIYDVPNGGTALWVETQSVRTVKGVFDANLGSVNPINLSFNTQYYLGVQLQGSSEMIPRLVLGASAYTLRAEQATVAESVSPSASGVVRSLNALHGDLILKGSGSTLVSVQRDTIDIFTQPSGLTEIRSADVALQVTSPQGPIVSLQLKDSSVSLQKLAPGVVPVSLPPSGIASGDLSGLYPAPQVANGVITNEKLATAAVTTAKLEDLSVTTLKLSDSSVTDRKIAHGISYAKLSGAPTSLPPSGAASGDLSGSYPAPVVAAGAITSTKLADDAVSTAKILDANVTSSKLADNAVTTAKITDAHVTSSKLADTAVTDSKIAHGISYAKLSGAPASLPPSGAASGDLSGSYPAPVVAAGAITSTKLADDAVSTVKILDANVTTSKLADNAVTTAKIADAHVTNSKLADTAVTDSKIAHGISYAKLSGAPTTLPPSGTASGDLSGSYPAPVVAAGAITNTKLADDAVSTAKILDANVTTSKLADNAVTTPKILDANVTTSKLADNAVTTTKIADAHVTNSKLADTAVTDSKIAHGISYAKLSGVPASLPPSGAASGDLSGSYPAPVVAAGAITNTKLADDAVSTAKILDANVTSSKLADNAVTTPKILDANVTTSKLADNAVTTAKITDAHVTSSKLADTAVTDSKIAHGISYAKLSGAPTTLPPSGAASGDLSGSYPAPVVAAGAITSTKLADDAVSTAKILDANVTSSKLADNAVTTPKILDANVTSSKLADNAVTTPKILDANVTSSKLADNAVTTAKITDAHVTNSKLADTAVTDSKIAHGISYAKLSGAPTTLPPSGAASGDLSGSYPAPVVAAGAITNTKLADDAVSTAKILDANVTSSKLADNAVTTPKILDANVTTSKLADNAVTTAKITDAHVTSSKLADTAVTDSKIAHGISYAKLSGAPTTLPPSGAASGDLSGSYPAPVVAAGAITNTKLADDAVSTAKILDANVTTSKLADNAVTTLKILDANVTTSKLADNAVTTPKILDANVTTSKLADNAVTTTKITDAHVTSSKLADTAVTNSKIAHGISYAKLSGAPTSLPPSGAASGDLSGSYPAPVVAVGAITNTKLADDAVSTTKILDVNVTTSKLADNAVNTSKLADGSVSTTKLADVAVTTVKVADASITNAKLADASVNDVKVASGISYAKLSGAPSSLPPNGPASGDLSGNYPAPTVGVGAITATKIANDAVTSAKIADANVTTAKLADEAITTAKLIDGSVTNVKLADAAVTDAKVSVGISYTKLSGAPLSLPPSGAASGDLSGTYPSPIVAANAITSSKIADANVTTVKLADAAVTMQKLHSGGASPGQVLQWNGSSWLPTTPTSMNYFSESRSTLPPNNSQPAHQFIVSGSDLAIDAVISPKGVGAFCLDLADNSSTGGAKRGLYAIDLQRVRNTASQVASGSYATILGGSNNTASGNYATIAGGASNSAGFCGTIGGGSGNTSNGNYSGSLSGVNNSAGGAGAVVAGGEQCNASAVRASITGGYGNTASLEGAHVGGGSFNAASNLNSVVAGGHFNVASNVRSAVGGGLSNTASGDGAVIAGGSYNISSGGVSAIIGGSNNLASGFASTVGGGTQDTASGTGSVVGGGQYCKASAGNSTVGGGSYNKATGLASTIAGGYNNEVFSSYASIGGGLSNVCSGIYATVAGGYGNAATVQSASVLGGEENWASGLYSGVFGGNSNSASGQHSYVLGGYNNTVATQFSSVLGGSNNASAAGAFHSVVLSGQLNEVSTGYSCILGGSSNTTSGHYNLVYGNGVTPTAAEPYRVYFFGGSASGMLSINRLDADYPIHVGTTSSDGNGAYLSAGGQWTDGSSRSFKDRYTTLDSADVLRKVKGLDLRGWWYKNTQEYHIGPFAEDFRENFGTGVLDNPSSSHYLSATDIAGVALYSSQQLIKSSEAQLARVAELEERVAKLESLLNSSDRRAISQGFAAQNVLPQTAPTEESAVRILSIVPDPASSQIVVHFRLEHSATVTLSIVSGTGELQQAVLTAMPMRSGSFEIDANIQNLASGWYLLNLESDTGAAQRLFRVLR